MTQDEHKKLENNSFEDLWDDLWQDTSKDKSFSKEFLKAKKKFDELKNNNFFNSLITKYLEPEWEFPKGRKQYMETKIDCAFREFQEETNINKNQINILERVNSLDEEYEGTDGKKYCHIFYLAMSKDDISLDINNTEQKKEVGNIKWLTVIDAINKVRDYQVVKKKILHQIYFFILNLISNINKQKLDNLFINIEN